MELLDKRKAIYPQPSFDDRERKDFIKGTGVGTSHET